MSKSLPYSSSPNISAGAIKAEPVVEKPLVNSDGFPIAPTVAPEPVVEGAVEEEKKTIKKKA